MSLRARKKQQARDDILAAAEKLISVHGYSNTTMKDIAAEANMSYQTLYNYFPTKAVIVQTMVIQDVATAAERAEELIANYQSDPIRLICSGAKVQLDMVSTRDRHLWREFVAEYLMQSQEMVAAYEHTDITAHTRIQRALEITQKRGHLDSSVNVETMANIIYNITEMAFLGYIMRPSLSKKGMLKAFQAEISLLMTPYLTNRD